MACCSVCSSKLVWKLPRSSTIKHCMSRPCVQSSTTLGSSTARTANRDRRLYASSGPSRESLIKLHEHETGTDLMSGHGPIFSAAKCASACLVAMLLSHHCACASKPHLLYEQAFASHRKQQHALRCIDWTYKQIWHVIKYKGKCI